MVLSLLSSPLGIIIGAAAGGGLLILILVIVAAVMCSRYRFCILSYKGVLQSNEFNGIILSLGICIGLVCNSKHSFKDFFILQPLTEEKVRPGDGSIHRP